MQIPAAWRSDQLLPVIAATANGSIVAQTVFTVTLAPAIPLAHTPPPAQGRGATPISPLMALLGVALCLGALGLGALAVIRRLRRAPEGASSSPPGGGQ